MNGSRSVYLDYNATTPLDESVVKIITRTLSKKWANPSSGYLEGKQAKEVINTARNQIADLIGASEEEIIFTSGGTESNHLALRSAIDICKRWCHRNGLKGKPHIITSSVEHDAVRKPIQKMEEEGEIDATFVPVSPVTGQVSTEDIIGAIRPLTCLVTVMHANNEVGVIQPIESICRRVTAVQRSPIQCKILIHTDAAQTIGKVPVRVKGEKDDGHLDVDFLTVAGHKFYGPRIGALYVKGLPSSEILIPQMLGGGQERGYRPGTENTPMIAGLGKAAEVVSQRLHSDIGHMTEVREYLEFKLKAAFQGQIRFNSHFKGSSVLPNTCNVSFTQSKFTGQQILQRVKHLRASAGAACHANNSHQLSSVLLAFGVPEDVAMCTVRLSVGRETTKSDIDIAVADLHRAIQSHLEEQNKEVKILK